MHHEGKERERKREKERERERCKGFKKMFEFPMLLRELVCGERCIMNISNVYVDKIE